MRGDFEAPVTWSAFREAAPGLADAVQERFESHRHAVMATLRRDGAPRLSGVEAPIRDGHLWPAMGTGSRKADDLRRDPRFSAHSAPDREDLASSDARIEGRAVPALETDVALFVEGHRFPIDDPSTMALFTADISRVVLARVEDRSLAVTAWTPEGELTEIRLPRPTRSPTRGRPRVEARTNREWSPPGRL